MSDKLNSSQNGSIGVIAAMIEGLVLQPTLYWKNARAVKLPFTLNPQIIYRGTLASLVNECQLLGFQFGATGFFQKLLHDKGIITNVETSEIVSAAIGGLLSTILTCPIEMVMIQQQKNGGSFLNTLYRVHNRYGVGGKGLFRGIVPTIGRETICVVGMLGITPIVSNLFLMTI
jgi:solute carrier family 25 (mitochondrial carnitine/acylcarnitine transporter), member 20/29